MASLSNLVGTIFQPQDVAQDHFDQPVLNTADGQNVIPAASYYASDADDGLVDTQTVLAVDTTDAANSYRLGTMTLSDTATSGAYPPFTYDIVGVNGDQVLLGSGYNGDGTWGDYVVLSNTDISTTDGFVPSDLTFSNENPFAYNTTSTNALLGRTFTSTFVSQDHFNNPDTSKLSTTGTVTIGASDYFASDTDDDLYDAQTVTGLDMSAANSYRLGTIVLSASTVLGGTYPAFTYDIVAENGDQLLLGAEYAGNDSWGDYVILSNSDITQLDGDGSTGFTFVNQDIYSDTSTSPTMPCFAAGTAISTPTGAVRVEALREGDLVRTVSGEDRPLVWVGHRRVDVARHPTPELVRPIRVSAGAFGVAAPAADLVVSPDHNLFVDGVLVPAKCLVNGRNVVELGVAAVTYHHIELATHDVVLANNMPAETYLDTGNRTNFDGADVVVAHPDFATTPDMNYFAWAAMGCAPLVLVGPALDAIRAELLARADMPAQTVLAA